MTLRRARRTRELSLDHMRFMRDTSMSEWRLTANPAALEQANHYAELIRKRHRKRDWQQQRAALIVLWLCLVGLIVVIAVLAANTTSPCEGLTGSAYQACVDLNYP